MSLGLGLALVLLAQGGAQPSRDLQKPRRPAAVEPPDTFLYYDYIEDGELRGGRVPIDRTNPLHASIGPEPRASGSPVVTLLDSGPSANRIDLVLVGDGYTAAQLGTYANDVDAVWPAFLAEPPLSSYATYFNVHRVDVVSAESGVDNDPSQGIQRSTALDMGYWCSGVQRLLCVNVSKAIAEANNAPDRDTVLALANSGTYGGAGYSSLGTLAGHNGSAIEIALHEFGHSFAGLADEYDYGGPTTYTGGEPSALNVSTLTEPELLAQEKKWYRWLDLPHFGAFEGGMYSQFGIYRPTFNSKMRNLGRPFQEFNAERLIRRIYSIVRPIDDATTAGRYPLDASFFVVPLQPADHALAVQWSLDGAPIPGATATTLDAATLGLTSGPRVLEVVVVDDTPMVRGPAVRDLMTERRSWILHDGRKISPQAAPTAVTGPVLALVAGGASAGGLDLTLELGPRPPRGPLLPVIEVARAGGRGPAARRALDVVEATSGVLHLHVGLPRDERLADRRVVVRAVLVPLDGSAPVRSAPLELVVEP